MEETLRWWLVLQLVALPVLPLCLAVFRRLPDRGFALSKPFGLVLLGFSFWFLNSVEIVPNSVRGILFAFAPLLAVAAIVAWRERDGLRDWFAARWHYALGVEALLFATLAVAIWLRSFVPAVEHTEQPMDLMFLSAADRAEHFPPEDPWLAGHTVAYYYFGYLLVAMVGKLAALPTDVSYNLGLAMTAALTLTAAFGLVYNLVRLREPQQAPPETPRALIEGGRWKAPAFALAGALMVVVMGNLVWVFTVGSAWGIMPHGVIGWLDIGGLEKDEPSQSWGPISYPSQFFAFFDASRIYLLNDPPPPVEDFRVITEFPMFSFVLGDLHPHVMALPFVLLAVGLALAFYRSDEPLDLAYWLRRPLLLGAAAVIIGALAFLNTWDIATMAFVVVAAAAAANLLQLRAAGAFAASPERSSRPLDEWLPAFSIVAGIMCALLAGVWLAASPSTGRAVLLVVALIVILGLWAAYVSADGWPAWVELAARVLSFALPLLMLAIALYAPFFRSFTSQADGVLPVISKPDINVPGTRPVHALIYWGPLFAVVVPFVLVRLYAARDRLDRRVVIGALAVPALVVVAWAVHFVIVTKITDDPDASQAFGFWAQVGDRGWGWVTDIVLGALLASALAALWLEVTAGDDDGERTVPVFVLGIIATALLLILGTEFFFVKDHFNSRMNTVFKLYYQAWVMLGLAGGFSLYYLASRWPAGAAIARVQEVRIRWGWGALAGGVLALAALYPVGATLNRTEGFGRPRAVSALENNDRNYPLDERLAIRWLRERDVHQEFVIVEAWGGDYWTGESPTARISAATGIPTVLGWEGHEGQWRTKGGLAAPAAGRKEDIEALYRGDLETVGEIVQKYGITHIYVGPVERRLYGEAALEKFKSLPAVYQNTSVSIYQATGEAATGEAAP